MMLLKGCWAVSVDPPSAYGSDHPGAGILGFEPSRMILAQIRRAARICHLLQKIQVGVEEEGEGGRISSRPAGLYRRLNIGRSRGQVKSTSCTAVHPASRMWYPLMLMLFHWGLPWCSIQSVGMMRMEGRGGKM